MKKYIFLLTLSAVILFAFTACANEETQETLTPQNNPFAGPLTDFFADSEEGLSFSTRAILVDVDGSDTLGVLAIRHEVRYEETGHHMPIPVARVFYLFEDELGFFDIQTFQDEPPIFVTAEDRLVRFGGHWSFNWATLFEIEYGRLVYAFTVFTELDADDIYGANPRHYHAAGGWHWQDELENHSPITQEEFADITSRYGLDNMTSWRNMDDETERILAMNFQ